MRRRERRIEMDAPYLPLDAPLKPPTAKPGETIPSPKQILDRINELEQNPPPPVPTVSSILSRLKALSESTVKPVPTTVPKIELIPRTGVSFDSLSKLTLPKREREPEKSEPPETPVIQAEVEPVVHYDKPIGFGIATALKYISDHGILKEHKGDDEQILEYRDEHGFKLSAKEAFKHQSHIFSGKKPGEKHRKKDMMRHRADEIHATAETGDTPLRTASSLRKVLSEKKQAFIELSGENRQVMPYEPKKEEQDKPKKKRLKLKKQ